MLGKLIWFLKKADKKAYQYLRLRMTQRRCWQPGQIFMQDNAPIHTAKIIKEYFESEGMVVFASPLTWRITSSAS